VIASFRNKALVDLWSLGSSSKIDKRLHERILLRLDRLDACSLPAEMNVPGFDFHALKGFTPTRYTVYVNGPWCLTFEFADGEVQHVDLEQYH
jgi:toxin HigB-1